MKQYLVLQAEIILACMLAAAMLYTGINYHPMAGVIIFIIGLPALSFAAVKFDEIVKG